MRQYELTYLISDDVLESEITKVSGKIGGIIADEKGKILKEESWGRRKLAYPIKKQLFATYITVNFELEPENLKNITRDLEHENSIIRQLIIVKDFGKEKLSLTAEDVAGTADIKQAVGGEKSFEAVEGETNESKDLMAVRGETKEQETDNKEKIVEKATETSVEGVPTKSVGKEKPIKIEKKPAVKKEVKKIEKVEAIKPVAKKEEVKTEKIAEKKPTKKKAVKKDSTASDEADRLAKLDEELNDILGEEL